MATVQEVYKRRFPARAARSWEVWWWFFMRVSGVLLLFLVLGHVAIMHVFGGGVDRINFRFVARRWAGYYWRTYDWLLLALALLHGAAGARTVIQDYVRSKRARSMLKALLLAATLFFFSIGTLVITTFDATSMPGGR